MTEKSFIKVKAPRTFGSMWYGDQMTGKSVPHVELIDGKWVETPEYLEMMKKKEDE